MDRWRGRTAVVSGGSSGIGEAVVKRLARHGLRVAALARRRDRLQALEGELKEANCQVKCLECDITKEEDVKAAFAWVDENWGQTDILINNAGVFPQALVTDEDLLAKTRQAYEVNVLGLMSCTKEMIRSLKKYKVSEGHIVNVNSVAGRKLIEVDGFLPYCSSKHAVNAISNLLRAELGRRGERVRVTNVSPGLTKSEMGTDVLNLFGTKMNILETDDVVDAIEYCLAAPTRVNISELTIQPIAGPILENEENKTSQ